MRQYLSDKWHLLFGELTLWESVEYMLFAAMAIVLPCNWQLVMWLMPLMAVTVIVRMIISRTVGNRSIDKLSRWILWLMVIFCLYQLLTMIYTSNKEDGWDMIVRRVPLLLFPLFCLAADTAFLTQNRKRALIGCFSVSLVVKFVVLFVAMFVKHHKFVYGSTFDSLHHTYMAMYLLFAIGFLYSEWCFRREEYRKGAIWIVYISAAILTTYLVMVQSRTGVTGLAVMVVAAIAHQIFGMHEVKRGLLLLAVVAVVGSGAYILMPESGHRVTKTLTEMSEGDTSDARYLIFGSSLKAIGENLPFGVGIGDKNDVLAKVYEDSGNEHAISAQYNSHNIFLDATLTMGIPGLLLLLALFVVPAVAAFKRNDFMVYSFLFSFAFSGLFEALLNRQMGIMFFALFWMLCTYGGNAQRPADFKAL